MKRFKRRKSFRRISFRRRGRRSRPMRRFKRKYRRLQFGGIGLF